MIEQQEELWIEIPDSKHYAISNKGRIKRLSYMKLHNINKTYFQTKESILIPSNNNSKKYWRIGIKYNDGVIRTKSIHRLVAEVFIENLNNLPQVNHKDGNKDNNNDWNLEWCTNLENNKHRYETLTSFSFDKGEKCNFSKLNAEQMFEIKKLVDIGVKKTIIARQFGVSPTTITEFTNGRSWRHLNLYPAKKKKSEKYFHIRYVPTT